MPFEDLFLSVVVEARKRREALAPTDHLLDRSPDAKGDCNASILRRLTGVSAEALYRWFDPKRAQFGISDGDGRAGRDNRTDYYAFIDKMRSTELVPFFTAFPALARVISDVAESWISATAEFLSRLCKDVAVISSAFPGWRKLLD